jgi:hypothetical protein|tara:strand:- start:1165 stop:1536 length:372 start_codon:yes stop_codon:yes gene_type:complete
MAKKTQNTSKKVTKVTTSDKKEKFLKALKLNLGNISEGCKAINISRQTYYRWIDDDQDFESKCQNVSESLLDLAENRLLEKINDYDTTSIIFFLKTKGRKRGYQEKQELELTKPISEINFEEI